MASVIAWLVANWRTAIVGGLFVVIMGLGLQVKMLQGDLQDARERVRLVGVLAENRKAELDSTRVVAGQFRRLAVQTEIERDSLAQELDERPVVEVPVVVENEPVVDTVQAELTDSTAYSSIETDLLIAEVEIDLHPPYVATWNVEVRPIRMLVGVRCGPVSQDTGIRPVQVTVEAEPWEVDIGRPRTDPEVCNPTPPEEDGGGFWKGVGAGALGVVTILAVFM